MDHFAGLDVSVKETSVCIVDDTGRILREVKVASEPEALLQVLRNPAYCFKRIGLEAGPLSQWLFSALAEADLPVICVETRHMQAVLKAQINKTDRNDARGIAQMMRVGLYRPVHVKTLRSQKLRMLLTHRKGAPVAKVWKGLVDGDITRQYVYGTRFDGKLKKGAPYAYVGDGDFKVVDGEILEVEPEKRLVMSWKAKSERQIRKCPRY